MASCGGSMQEAIPVPDEPEDPTENKLWIGNLDPRLTELALVKILQKFGKLKKFDFLYHKAGPDLGKPRGYCFVTYEDRKDAERAIQKMNGKLALSRKLVVRWARTDTEEKKETDDEFLYQKGVDPSPENQIKAIEAKLQSMEKSEIDFPLDGKPKALPGSSQLSAVNIEARKKMEATTKPYQKKIRR